LLSLQFLCQEAKRHDETPHTSGSGRSGARVCKGDGTEAAPQQMAHTIPVTLEWDETCDSGGDISTSVDDKDDQ
jgi:arylsulfatase